MTVVQTNIVNLMNSSVSSACSSASSNTNLRGFSVSDTRRMGPKANGRLRSLMRCSSASSTECMMPSTPRGDISMPTQREMLSQHRAKCLADWLKEHAPRPLTEQEKICSLKMIVVEAERFQEERGMRWFKDTVLVRAAQNLGAACPKEFMATKRASNVVLNDIDVILALPQQHLPAGTTGYQYAATAVLALPMWRCPNAESNGPTARSTSPVETRRVVKPKAFAQRV